MIRTYSENIAIVCGQPKSHLTREVTMFCNANQIVLLPLLANATHLLQPLDVAVLKPLKNLWYQRATAWRMQNGGRTMRKDEFIVLFQEAFKETNPAWLVNGFRACSISPLNPDAVDYGKCCQRSQPNAQGGAGPNSLDLPGNPSQMDRAPLLPFIFELEERLNHEQRRTLGAAIGKAPKR